MSASDPTFHSELQVTQSQPVGFSWTERSAPEHWKSTVYFVPASATGLFESVGREDFQAPHLSADSQGAVRTSDNSVLICATKLYLVLLLIPPRSLRGFVSETK